MKYLLTLIVVGCLSALCRAQDEPPPPLPPELAARLGHLLEQDWKDRPEWATMAALILKNEPMGHGKGWFTGAKSRYGWTWLAETFPEESADHKIDRDEIPQLAEADFERLDRNNDDAISEHDFDWSQGNPMMSGFSPSDMVFDQLDHDFNGRLTREEVLQFFDKAGDGFDFLTMEDLRRGLDLKMPDRSGGLGRKPTDQRWLFMTRLLNGEPGSLTSGPNLEDEAPELNLPLVAHNEDRSKLTLTEQFVELKQFRGKKPVVLIFGSFT
jgi:hypothetical protein